MKQGESPIADHFDNTTVLFADLLDMLNLVFTDFDHLTEKYSLEKIKTIDDSYMVAGGLPEPCADHAEKVAEMAMDMQEQGTDRPQIRRHCAGNQCSHRDQFRALSLIHI